jgi:hypothetical protein
MGILNARELRLAACDFFELLWQDPDEHLIVKKR